MFTVILFKYKNWLPKNYISFPYDVIKQNLEYSNTISLREQKKYLYYAFSF